MKIKQLFLNEPSRTILFKNNVSEPGTQLSPQPILSYAGVRG